MIYPTQMKHHNVLIVLYYAVFHLMNFITLVLLNLFASFEARITHAFSSLKWLLKLDIANIEFLSIYQKLFYQI